MRCAVGNIRNEWSGGGNNHIIRLHGMRGAIDRDISSTCEGHERIAIEDRQRYLMSCSIAYCSGKIQAPCWCNTMKHRRVESRSSSAHFGSAPLKDEHIA